MFEYMYYAIKAGSYTHLQEVCGNEVIDLGESTMAHEVAYDASDFCGYSKCDCCEERVATFLFKRIKNVFGQDVSYYIQANAEDVVEYADYAALEAGDNS